MDGIQRDVEKLERLARLDGEDFAEEDNFIRAQFYLRRALEGVFHIASHLVSRKTGNRSTQYKEIARALADAGFMDKKFVEESLVKMAGYRNRLTQFYADVTPDELQSVLRNHLGDILTFLKQIKQVLDSPKQFGVEVE
jgi:uncharacterized protein YutE (UPF0331/DUF86 family)